MPRSPLITAVALLVLLLPAALPAGAGLSSPPPVRAEAASPELRAFWVDAWSDGFKTPAQVQQLVADAHTANANTLVVQVRRRGDSYYNESVEPRAADAALDPAPFDPLASLIAAAHAADPPLHVYAWVVVFPVWHWDDYSTTDPSRHVYYRHGCGNGCDWSDPDNWLTYRYNGGNPVPDYELDPGHPAAAAYTVDVVLHLVRHYDVDGIALDYIRYGGQDYGYNKVSEDRFHAAYGGSGHPSPTDANWMAWRREQVTKVVRRIYLEALAVKPDLVVGAATIAWGNGPDQAGGWENSSAYKSVFQDWRGWLEAGIVDLALPMNYDREHQPPQDQYFRNWVDWEKNHQYGRAVAPSPGAFINYISGSLVQAAVVQAPSSQGFHALGTAFYSYASTNIDGQPNSVFYAALAQPSGFGTPPWATPASAPGLPWKTAPTTGHLAGWAIGTGGPLDRANVQVSGPVSLGLLTDGNGFFGATDLPPGDYTITLPAPAASPLYATVTPGKVALATVAASQPPALRAVLVDAAHDGFKTPDQVDVLLADARAAHLNAVVVQMRSFGQIYYDSPYEPRAADPELAAGFDPLAYLLQQAHSGTPSIAVYAWVPALAVWSGDLGGLPAGHVLQTHQDWLTENISGTQSAGGVYYLDPGHPGALAYTVDLAVDLIGRYPLDGLLLDSLHYPYEGSAVGYAVWGYHPVSLQRFHARYGGSGDPSPGDPVWLSWRREQLTALLRQLYLRCTGLRPRLRVAAVGIAWGDSPDHAGGWEQSSAYGRLLQDWRGWLQEGIVDLAAPTNYDREYQVDQQSWYDHWLAWEAGQRYDRGLLVLQGAYLNYPEHALAQVQEAVATGGAAGLAWYIPADLYADPDGNSRSIQPPRQPWYYTPQAEWWLWRALALPYGYTDPADGAFYATAPIFAGVVPTPTLSWKDTPERGQLAGWALGPGLVPLTVPVTITLHGPSPRTLYNDGSGFFGAVDLLPGDYLAMVSEADPAYRVLAGTVAPGQVVWLQPAQPVTAVAVSGPDRLSMGIEGLFGVTYPPPAPSPPITVTWDNGALGQSAVYSWTTVGTKNVAVTATNCCGSASAVWTVTVFCQEVTGLALLGPQALLVGQAGSYAAAVQPITASRPLTVTWDNGTVGPTAAYSWTISGTYAITASAANACGQCQGMRQVRVYDAWPYSIYLPLIVGRAEG